MNVLNVEKHGYEREKGGTIDGYEWRCRTKGGENPHDVCKSIRKEKQKIELAKLQLAQLEKEVELQRAKNKALSLNPAAKVEEKQFETLNKETATHIGIREAEYWFRPIDLAKECDIYISSRSGSHKEIPITYGYTQDPFKNRSQNFKPKIKENYPQYLERENKN
ncbi:hypothetical protein TNCV_1553031 [Trichonephila clavipes]|nr:hypothetical protein TNCV_1553031 [Trichonephila clavipes]